MVQLQLQYSTVQYTILQSIHPANARACPNTYKYIIILLRRVSVDAAVPGFRHQLVALAEPFSRLLHLLCGLR
jgi:hypothetical protein